MDETSIILCVDDDSTVLSALRSMLSTHFGSELQVEFAESGGEALEIEAELQALNDALLVERKRSPRSLLP